MEKKVCREIAEQDFERFAAMARLKLDGYRNEADQASLDNNRELFVECVEDGSIIVDDEGWPTIKTECESLPEVRFPRRPQGFDRCAMDRAKANEQNAKVYLWVGSVTGASSALLKKLEEHDWKKVWCVFELFLDQRT